MMSQAERHAILERMSEGFMVPEIDHDTRTLWTRRGESYWQDESPGEGWIAEEQETGYFARLSAPGYMDCTEWSGPFKTEEEAEQYLVDTYGDDIEIEESEESEATS